MKNKRQLKKLVEKQVHILLELTQYEELKIREMLNNGYLVSDIIKNDFKNRQGTGETNNNFNEAWQDYQNTEIANVMRELKK